MWKGKKMKNRKKSPIKLPFWGIGVICLIFCLQLTVFGAKDIYAATQKVKLTDNSGSYIHVKTNSSGNSYYLYDKEKRPLTGIQYIKIPTIEKGISSGYYMFDENGQLIRKRSVYKLTKKKVNGLLFHGYYYTNKNGKFLSSEYGIFYLSNLICNGHNFNGYFYLQKYGKLNAPTGCRYISARKVNGVSFEAGYYWFSSSGKMKITPGFKEVHGKVNSVNFNGTYYFGEKNGMLEVNKAGLREIGGKTYYLSKWGKRAENTWVKNHYFQADGTMAVKMKTPDGSYVDDFGVKVTASEFKKMQTLKTSIQKIIQSHVGTWSVYVKNLNTDAALIINDCSMYAASTIKPFVMASTFDLINQGKLKYDANIKELMWYMITESNNICTNDLIRYNSQKKDFLDGARVINEYITKKGYHTAQVHHMLQSQGYYITDGGSNRMCATDAGLLLEKIYKGTCVNEKYSKEMLRLLLNQQRRWKIPAGVPAGTKVANKTGETSSTEHDMAIVYGPKATYILCVFTTNATEYYGIRGIREISKTVYEALNK